MTVQKSTSSRAGNAPTPHGRGVRGLGLSRSSLLFTGAFGRMFRALPPAEFGVNDAENLANLHELAVRMVSGRDEPKDGPDAEESGIPALYTYLGQFVDHDLTFDPASSLQQQNDPDGLVDFRTPRFDLDNVYGRGPDDQPYLYDFSGGPGRTKFWLGKPLSGGGALNQQARDLPRNDTRTAPGQPARAIIGDPRNDENVLVSQFQSLFFRFHNRLIEDRGLSFADAQRTLRFHYQWMLIHDFLVKLVNPETLHSVFPHLANGTSIAKTSPVLRFYHAKNDAFMPLEFSVAAYRFGHSMVRPGYRLNDADETLLPIFGQKGRPERPHSLRGFMAPADNWALDWARFIDIENRPNGVMLDEDHKTPEGNDPTPEQLEENKRRLQLAYRIDSSIAFPLGDLPSDIADLIVPSLAERNLLRGWRLRLPTGQSVAKAMGEKVLDEVLIGKFAEQPETQPIESVRPVFANNCPLWTYCLAETAKHTVIGHAGVRSKLLGPVGGRIVAETFAGLLMYDSQSFLSQDPTWRPTIGDGAGFGLREFVNFALGR
ncbi:MAG: heme peroxidase family protein [Candidatus Solibacter sp.]